MGSQVTSLPPKYRHASIKITPKQAQENLVAFLAKTPSQPHLHPDAILSQDGIKFPAQSGPQGGLAIHHLRRIEAGLRGENLLAESKEELRALFSDEPQLPTGNDDRLDGLIERSIEKSTKRSKQISTLDGTIDADEYAHEQTEVNEEIGNDTLAGQGEQVHSIPEIRTDKSAADRAERNAKKKAARKAEKRAKLKQAQPAG